MFDSLEINAYSYNNWVSCSYNHRSTGAHCIFVRENLVLWYSGKHKTIFKSSTQSEYRALSFTAREFTWLKSLLGEFHIYVLTFHVLFCDNFSAPTLTILCFMLT